MIWRGKRDRIPQPPISAATRDPERHSFWTGAVIAAAAVLLLVCGAGRPTSLETAEGDTATEQQLVKSFAYGALRLAPPPSPPDPARYEDPAEAAAAMEKFARDEQERPKIKYVVHTSVVDPCPT